VPPEVVFKMLGGMFSEFDALAHRLGIFKGAQQAYQIRRKAY
jgi:hypothetical protein